MKPRPAGPMELVVDALAVYRLTRLVTRDVLTQPLRELIIARQYGHDVDDETFAEGPDRWQQLVDDDDDPPKIAYLVTCPWCSSVYVAGAAVAARLLAPRLWSAAARGLALSAAGALVALAEGKLS